MYMLDTNVRYNTYLGHTVHTLYQMPSLHPIDMFSIMNTHADNCEAKGECVYSLHSSERLALFLPPT